MTTPAAPKPQVLVTVDTPPGPDGKPWVSLQIQLGLAVSGIVIPPETAAELATILAEQLTAGAQRARLAGGGIILAAPNVPASALPAQLRQPNGRKPSA